MLSYLRRFLRRDRSQRLHPKRQKGNPHRIDTSQDAGGALGLELAMMRHAKCQPGSKTQHGPVHTGLPDIHE